MLMTKKKVTGMGTGTLQKSTKVPGAFHIYIDKEFAKELGVPALRVNKKCPYWKYVSVQAEKLVGKKVYVAVEWFEGAQDGTGTWEVTNITEKKS